MAELGSNLGQAASEVVTQGSGVIGISLGDGVSVRAVQRSSRTHTPFTRAASNSGARRAGLQAANSKYLLLMQNSLCL